MGIVIGREGRTIRTIGAAARERIEALTGSRVYLDLRVKVMAKWRRRDPALKRLGYLS
jgi:GTP-binding protein Era